jgi:hypothetical protein
MEFRPPLPPPQVGGYCFNRLPGPPGYGQFVGPMKRPGLKRPSGALLKPANVLVTR